MKIVVVKKAATAIIRNCVFVCSCVVLSIISLSACDTSKTIPDEVQAFIDAYLEAFQKGTEVSVDYVYYPEEYKELYTAYRYSGDILVSYEILDRTQINDNLYVFRIYYVTKLQETEAYTFVAWIDGEYRVILNTGYLPYDMRQDVSEDDYPIKSSPNIEHVDPSDIIGNIN